MRHWKKLLWGSLCLLSLLGLFLMRAGDKRMIRALTPQLSAARWEAEDKPYAMASAVMEAGAGVDPGRMGEIFLKVENALTAGGVGSSEYPWYYAASCMLDGQLRAENGGSCSVELTAVGGDFFQAHPMRVLSGWYFDQNDVMRDRIVLDRRSAWDLFYSYDVAGQFVELDGTAYLVAAVVDLEDGKQNEMAAGDTRRAWVLWDSPALGEREIEFTCMEMILPQPVKDFAVSTLRLALADQTGESLTVIDNSGRFSLKNRWDVLRHISTRGISDGGAAYPYWENAARLTENRLALRLIPEALLLLFPAVSLIILLLWLNRRRTWGLRSLKNAAETLVDRKRQRDYAARQQMPAERDPLAYEAGAEDAPKDLRRRN